MPLFVLNPLIEGILKYGASIIPLEDFPILYCNALMLNNKISDP